MNAPARSAARSASSLPRRAGTGYKPQHFASMLENPLPGGFIEVHAENYMGAGGPPHAMLERLAADYPLSVHGIGLSLGGEEPLDLDHLARLKALCARYQPQSFSEHLAWSSHGGEFLADLLPLAYTDAALARIADHIDQVQEVLGRQMLLENPSTYLAFAAGGIDEADFLRALVSRTGCGLLLDINNVYVSASNHDYSPTDYLDRLPLDAAGEIHLAGHFRDESGILIDTHGDHVIDAVWSLYARTIECGGPRPTLIEWDNDVPAWDVLRAEALKADAILLAAAP